MTSYCLPRTLCWKTITSLNCVGHRSLKFELWWKQSCFSACWCVRACMCPCLCVFPSVTLDDNKPFLLSSLSGMVWYQTKPNHVVLFYCVFDKPKYTRLIQCFCIHKMYWLIYFTFLRKWKGRTISEIKMRWSKHAVEQFCMFSVKWSKMIFHEHVIM